MGVGGRGGGGTQAFPQRGYDHTHLGGGRGAGERWPGVGEWVRWTRPGWGVGGWGCGGRWWEWVAEWRGVGVGQGMELGGEVPGRGEGGGRAWGLPAPLPLGALRTAACVTGTEPGPEWLQALWPRALSRWPFLTMPGLCTARSVVRGAGPDEAHLWETAAGVGGPGLPGLMQGPGPQAPAALGCLGVLP